MSEVCEIQKNMALGVIDLTLSSPEIDETPRRVAASALEIFQPRKKRADGEDDQEKQLSFAERIRRRTERKQKNERKKGDIRPGQQRESREKGLGISAQDRKHPYSLLNSSSHSRGQSTNLAFLQHNRHPWAGVEMLSTRVDRSPNFDATKRRQTTPIADRRDQILMQASLGSHREDICRDVVSANPQSNPQMQEQIPSSVNNAPRSHGSQSFPYASTDRMLSVASKGNHTTHGQVETPIAIPDYQSLPLNSFDYNVNPGIEHGIGLTARVAESPNGNSNKPVFAPPSKRQKLTHSTRPSSPLRTDSLQVWPKKHAISSGSATTASALNKSLPQVAEVQVNHRISPHGNHVKTHNPQKPTLNGRVNGFIDGTSSNLKNNGAPFKNSGPIMMNVGSDQRPHGTVKQNTPIIASNSLCELSGAETGGSEHRIHSTSAPSPSRRKRTPTLPPPVSTHSNKRPGSGGHGTPYTAEEDALLVKLKEVDGLHWSQLQSYFNGRTLGSLQVRYSTKLARRTDVDREAHTEGQANSNRTGTSPRPRRKQRGAEKSVTEGFVSWADIKKARHLDKVENAAHPEDAHQDFKAEDKLRDQRLYEDKSVTRILRNRELGYYGSGSLYRSEKSMQDALALSIFDSIGPIRYFKGTSGDVMTLAWAPDGHRFAAGSIAICDERSMQYNRPCNLMVGNHKSGIIKELPEHYIRRPIVASEDGSNPNALQSMRETQDPQLFTTVAGVQFSPDSKILYSAGRDCKARAYDMTRNISEISPLYNLQHPAPIDLLTVSNTGVLATGCHQPEDGSISIFQSGKRLLSLSPIRSSVGSKRAIYPSALKWGAAWAHSGLLLAGFASGAADEQEDTAGETCLWDVRAEQRIETQSLATDVFDVAWNPSPSSASTVFAVACSSGNTAVNRGSRSIIQCFAPGQGRASRVLEWHCPALDINDVVYCPYDDNLIAAGATDGKIYIWDKRYADHQATPLHIFAHGDSLSVLDHDRDRALADTGVRFLSWGATGSRLYSGSSDGIVKLWDPYRTTQDSHIKDVATFTSAIMSGAFSPDLHDLLIGEDQGKINHLGIDYEEVTIRSHKPDFRGKPAGAARSGGPPIGSNAVDKRSTSRYHEEKLVTPLQQFELLPSTILDRDATTENDSRAVCEHLVDTHQIVYQPAGSLPVRQAVQGPNYRGPYFGPSQEDWKQANLAFSTAVEHQQNLRRQFNHDDPADKQENQETLKSADLRIKDAEMVIDRLNRKLVDLHILEKGALGNQAALSRAADEQLLLEHRIFVGKSRDQCKLDCNYLPAHADSDGGVPVSRCAENRVPGSLREFSNTIRSDPATQTLTDLVAAGYSRKCSRCTRPTRPSISPLWPLCEKCQNTSKGLTARCRNCSAPVRPSSEPLNPQNLCERCDFRCFRCAKPALISADAAHISCSSCGIVWRAGVLGYDIVERHRSSRPTSRIRVSHSLQDERVNDDDANDDGGLELMTEYYHTQWS